MLGDIVASDFKEQKQDEDISVQHAMMICSLDKVTWSVITYDNLQKW